MSSCEQLFSVRMFVIEELLQEQNERPVHTVDTWRRPRWNRYSGGGREAAVERGEAYTT